LTARKVANAIADTRERAIKYCNDVKGAYFDKIRYHVDKLEHLVNDEDWSLPKYRELLILKIINNFIAIDRDKPYHFLVGFLFYNLYFTR
jgi:hypothetical protein